MKIKIICLANNNVGMGGPLRGEHGASYLIDEDGKRILFDTGTSWDVLQHNLNKLDINLRDVANIVLSHGHYDHTGGLLGALSQMNRPCIIADPLLFSRKLSRNPETGEMRDIGLPHPRARVEELASLRLTVDPVEVLPGVTVTGRIPRVTDFEPTPAKMLIELDGKIEPDLLWDDRSIVMDLGEQLVLLCGCCHSGLVNTLMYVRKEFAKPVMAIIGGIHLFDAKPERIEKTIKALQNDFQADLMYFNHCTGLEATAELRSSLGERVNFCPVGTVLEFE